MKFSAVFLSVCILFLSLAGMVKPMQPPGKSTHCHQMAGMSASTMKKMKERHERKSCGKQACTMLFSCPLCGFIVVEHLTCQPNVAVYTEQQVSLYRIGDLSAYHPSDWKPPKAC